MPSLKGSKTEANLKEAFAGDSQGTVALVAPVGAQAGANAIFVCDTP